MKEIEVIQKELEDNIDLLYGNVSCETLAKEIDESYIAFSKIKFRKSIEDWSIKHRFFAICNYLFNKAPCMLCGYKGADAHYEYSINGNDYDSKKEISRKCPKCGYVSTIRINQNRIREAQQLFQFKP